MEFTFAEEMLNVMLENGMIDEEIKQWGNNYIEEQKEKKEPVKEVKKRGGRKKKEEVVEEKKLPAPVVLNARIDKRLHGLRRIK